MADSENFEPYEDTGDETQPFQETERLCKSMSELKIDPQLQYASKTIKLPLHSDIGLEARAAARQPTIQYDKLLENSLFAVVCGLVDEFEQLHLPIVDTGSRVDLHPRLIEMLASIPKQILYHLVAGNLEQAISNEQDVAELFATGSEWLEPSAEEDTPLVYARILVDEHSQMPTSAQYTTVIARLRAYISGTPQSFDGAAELDTDNRHQATREDIRRGDYRWLAGQTKRVQVVETFCMALQIRIKDDTIKTPQMYIGYTKDTEERREQHDKGDSSSWLQQLVLAAFKAEFPDNGFRLIDREICYMAFEWEVGLAEAFLTVLTDSYYQTGGGFNVVPGGIQVTSAKFQKLRDNERQAIWKERADWRQLRTEWCYTNIRRERILSESNNNAALLPSLQVKQNEQAKADAAWEKARQKREELRALLSRNRKAIAEKLQDLEETSGMLKHVPQWVRDEHERMWNETKTAKRELKEKEAAVEAAVMTRPGS